MAGKTEYVIHTDVKFGPMDVVDVLALVSACKETWFNQTLCKVNDCIVRMGILHGEFHWHHHDEEDEFFYVIDGRLLIDFEDCTEELTPGKGILVPSKIRHKTRAPEKTVVLMFEGAGVVPTGD